MGFDGLFLYYMMRAYAEIQITKYLFEKINLKEDEPEESPEAVREFSKIASHHDTVLK